MAACTADGSSAGSAVQLGLADRTGRLEDAIKLAKQKGKALNAKAILYRRPYGYAGSIYAESQTPRPRANVLQLELPESRAFLPSGFYYLGTLSSGPGQSAGGLLTPQFVRSLPRTPVNHDHAHLQPVPGAPRDGRRLRGRRLPVPVLRHHPARAVPTEAAGVAPGRSSRAAQAARPSRPQRRSASHRWHRPHPAAAGVARLRGVGARAGAAHAAGGATGGTACVG